MGLLSYIINLTTYTNMGKDTKELIQQLGQKMDLIAALLLRLLPPKELSLKEQVRLLNDLKIRPVEMSKITGRSQGHVGKELVAIRKEK
ncbi:MAG: hypothetical protein COY66_05260 [Candidatus Kerfeldbacteria bacterium CG_4_10_14_0_8_um_filter_42_10]|uniref:Uncharacterized protein n=1 Tax=Candidatus Kerfeldbacteria bacterium CG_4_10_14_0_8_um_filter_42_10 TaxID=2014248 RepID=A0A2M7RHJ0_9BACT|nr:MAG: hypothetical protein COY66_05260 [Candidatus Kerfeldbacteria bacterium CG_4_10_14_0_8_um_filter_42_10]